jgi:uncharacterized protein YggT (Ycf19 family)
VAIALAMLRTVVLVAAFSLVGRWLVSLFQPRGAEENFVFQLFSVVARPALKLTRWLLPRTIPDRRLPMLALALTLLAFLGLGLWQRDVCLGDLTQVGCEKWAAARTHGTR